MKMSPIHPQTLNTDMIHLSAWGAFPSVFLVGCWNRNKNKSPMHDISEGILMIIVNEYPSSFL